MTSRLPNGPKANLPQLSLRPLRSTARPQAAQAPKLLKTSEQQEALATEAKAWMGADSDHSLEIRAAAIEQRMGESGATEKSAGEEAKSNSQEGANEAHAKEQAKNLLGIKFFQKPGTQQKPPLQQKPKLNEQQPQKPQVQQSRLSRIRGQETVLNGQLAKFEKPPDASQLLKNARPAGELFVEDNADGSGDDEMTNPGNASLDAAVEECIRLCFGVAGIHHIGPGRNDADEPIIIVATMQGFSQASFDRVPEKVHGYNTLVAIPFDLLPLKRPSLLGPR